MVLDIVNGIFAVTYFYKKANERRFNDKNSSSEEEKNSDEEEDKIRYLPLNFLLEGENENILKESIPDFSFEKVFLNKNKSLKYLLIEVYIYAGRNPEGRTTPPQNFKL